MKKLLIFSLVIISFIANINAQFTKIGGGLTYGTGYHYNNENTGPLADLHRSPFMGIFLTGIYEITLPVHIAPSFTYFIPRTNKAITGYNGEDTKVSEMLFDINGHYVFNSLNRFEFYGLAGLNIIFTKIKWMGTGSSSDSDNAMGLNVGVGSHMKITEQFDLYGEAKYIISKYDQFVVNVGVLINIDWMKKHENADM